MQDIYSVTITVLETWTQSINNTMLNNEYFAIHILKQNHKKIKDVST
jgi:hypothetical protein